MCNSLTLVFSSFFWVDIKRATNPPKSSVHSPRNSGTYLGEELQSHMQSLCLTYWSTAIFRAFFKSTVARYVECLCLYFEFRDR